MTNTVRVIRSFLYKPLDFIGEITNYGRIFRGVIYLVALIDKPLLFLLKTRGAGRAV